MSMPLFVPMYSKAFIASPPLHPKFPETHMLPKVTLFSHVLIMCEECDKSTSSYFDRLSVNSSLSKIYYLGPLNNLPSSVLRATQVFLFS